MVGHVANVTNDRQGMLRQPYRPTAIGVGVPLILGPCN